jgi:DNA-binding GntR family transcriptional regulator
LEPLGGERNLPNRIAENLAEAIIDGRIGEGAKLREVPLAETFGLSRTPVREALRLLERDGLVSHEPRRGIRVVRFTPSQVAGIYACRAYLGGFAARLASPSLNESDLQTLDGWLDEMRQAAEARDARRHYRIVLKWQVILSQRSNNEFLMSLTRSLGRRTERLQYVATAIPGQMDRSDKRHDELLEALAAHDGSRAELVMRRTIAEAGEAIIGHHFGLSAKELAAGRYKLTEIVGAS